MMYADHEYYLSKYLLGREPAVPEADFQFWEKQARAEVDAYTYGRLKEDASLITDEVKDCVCAVAELLCKSSSLAEASLQEGAAGPLASYSNDGQSATYNLTESIYTESGKRKEIRRLVYQYLGATGLLYAGVRGCCC